MTTRYRLLELMLIVKGESGPTEVRPLVRVTPEELAKMYWPSVPRGMPTHYAVFPEPEDAYHLPLVEPKKKET
jgi:hypothetical protein